MPKRLSTVLLLGGLLGLTPTAATAATAAPAPPAGSYDLSHKRDRDHYRCMYRCDERRRHHGHKHRHRGHHRYERNHHRHYCWYRGQERWYQAPCGHRRHW